MNTTDKAPLSPTQSHLFQPLYRTDEKTHVSGMMETYRLPDAVLEDALQRACGMITHIRSSTRQINRIETILSVYKLSEPEGLALMCLAEALLRIPDTPTQVAFIRDKLTDIPWLSRIGDGQGVLADLSALGLGAASSFLKWGQNRWLEPLAKRVSDPTIRRVVLGIIRLMGHQFVMGETIDKALARAGQSPESRHSFDMLGEGAKTMADADRYVRSYEQAIAAIGQAQMSSPSLPLEAIPSISIKLSALHPRYELTKPERLRNELYDRIHHLSVLARNAHIGLTIDAEESERLEPSLALFERLALDEAFRGWDGLGLAVQAYQKRALGVITWITDLAERSHHRFPLRLVKGAYWDSEIKKCQERGLSDYPVFTRKEHTDISYLSCAQKMLAAPTAIYPQFATHNALTASIIFSLAKNQPFEFQRLHGMGESVYAADPQIAAVPCRVYAPVGYHRDLLAYLVRRLLENGANSSFVNNVLDSAIPLEALLQDPYSQTDATPHPKLPLPRHLYGPARLNAKGIDLWNPKILEKIYKNIEKGFTAIQAYPSVSSAARTDAQVVTSPQNPDVTLGYVTMATAKEAEETLKKAINGFTSWGQTSVEERASILEKVADKLETSAQDLITLLVWEAGKTVSDAVSEVREAVDFCRYYAQEARRLMVEPTTLFGPTGETNQLYLSGRGVFACISPWNFPLAIFIGQISAALVTGNVVIAKPAQQTSLIAYKVCELMYGCGIPRHALFYLPISGALMGQKIIAAPRLGGVAFTGSTAVGQQINRTLSEREAPIVPLIAETGGLNAMIVDSTALPEQVVQDVLTSAFQSAGQRCSALRVLCVQEDIFETVQKMLIGALKEWQVGAPQDICADSGPLIDSAACARIQEQTARLSGKGASKIFEHPHIPTHGSFLAPQIWQASELSVVDEEIFGPVLVMIPFAAATLPTVVHQINALGYGLTLGVHSRLEKTIAFISQTARVGNIYINRSMIGAVVGVQPFGGEGRSGTGPKAGGPHYLTRFIVERTVSRDTTAAGGNASLLVSL